MTADGDLAHLVPDARPAAYSGDPERPIRPIVNT